jgi:hypothetical protein
LIRQRPTQQPCPGLSVRDFEPAVQQKHERIYHSNEKSSWRETSGMVGRASIVENGKLRGYRKRSNRNNWKHFVNEKIASDLGYFLGLPIAPIETRRVFSLWGLMYENVSLEPFIGMTMGEAENSQKYHHTAPLQTIASAMIAFNTWVSADDLGNENILVDPKMTKATFIDYETAFKDCEWGVPNTWNKCGSSLDFLGYDAKIAFNMANHISSIEKDTIWEVVTFLIGGKEFNKYVHYIAQSLIAKMPLLPRLFQIETSTDMRN